MTELLRVYNELYLPKCEYCVICLRSGKERRMVDIKSLEQFIKSINLPFNYDEDFQKVCYICERAAAAALRFRLALSVSSSVHNLFLMMHSRPATFKDITRQVTGLKPKTGVVRNVSEWEERVGSVRTRSALLRTDVLLVDSLAHPEPEPPAQASAPPAAEVAAPDAEPGAPPLSTADVLSEPEIYMESVTLVDEETDPIQIKREDPPPETRIEPSTSNSCLRPAIVPLDDLLESPNSSFLLHPIVENYGVITVPTLGAQIVNGQLVTISNSTLMMQTPKLALHNGVNFNLVSDPTQVASVLKTMGSSDVSNIAIVSDDIPINAMENNVLRAAGSQEGRRAAGRPLSTNAGQVVVNQPAPSTLNSLMGFTPSEGFLSEQALPTSDTCRSIIIEDEDSSCSQKRRKRSESGTEKTDGEKSGSKQRETDWEDKIPMDVISFMDATDPNAPSVLTQEESPIACISNVHSVATGHISPERDNSHSPRDNVTSRRDKSNSPKANVTSRRNKSNSPGDNITSKRDKSNSPGDNAPSQRGKSNSPRDNVTSQRDKSNSPRNSNARKTKLIEALIAPRQAPTPSPHRKRVGKNVKLVVSSRRTALSNSIHQNVYSRGNSDDDFIDLS